MCPTGTSRALPPHDQSSSSAALDFRQVFNLLDADHDGKISGDDLRAFYAGLSGTDDQERDETIRSMIMVADSNRSGFVEYDEFERVLGFGKAARKTEAGGVMEDVFNVMDTDGDGKLSFADLKSYMGWAGFEASDDDIKAMIKLGGGHEDEGVSFHGLLQILALDPDRR